MENTNTILLGDKFSVNIVTNKESIGLDTYTGDNIIMFNHIKRVMVKFSTFDRASFINKLKDVYQNAYEYCTHSGDKLNTSIGQIITSDAFTDQYYSYVTSNTITDRYKNDSLALSLQICLSLCTLTNISDTIDKYQPKRRKISAILEYQSGIIVLHLYLQCNYN